MNKISVYPTVLTTPPITAKPSLDLPHIDSFLIRYGTI